MAEPDVDTSGADGVSKDSYEDLKRELERTTGLLRASKASNLHYDARERQRIAGYQPAAKDLLEVLMSDADDDTKLDLAPMQTWANEFHEKPDVLAQVSLARTMSCASSLLKRSREEASANSEASATLGKVMKDMELLVEEKAKLSDRVNELTGLADEHRSQNQALAEQLELAGLVANKYNFSKVASREVDAKGEVKAEVEVVPPTAALTQITSNASGAAAMPSLTDRLLADIVTRGGPGSSRFVGSKTSHSLLGVPGGAAFDVASAILGSA